MLQVTESARTAMLTAIAQAERPVAGLRIMVESGGCAGLRYGMALELAVEPDDATFEFDGLTVLIDPESRAFLEGVKVDFVSDLEGAGFVFDNPNARTACGCGKSFC
ncbi:MAG: HesB/IscA family protein [Alphaproteobacteria bacterium]